ncbi:MAG: hypothetical protein FJ253_00700 [Phycisphaerae bacterium]|nr:hypothetical protein [Phycisphaerae bacterium]
MFDVIGDIHGHADALKALLEKLGHREGAESWRHPGRTAVFVGDFVDRGPGIAETLSIVRRMVESGAAMAVLGNHEINALAFATERDDCPGEYCRSHSERNCAIHAATLSQLSQEERDSALEWFRTLPVALDLGGVRVVHACWDDAAIQRLAAVISREGGALTPRAVRDLHRKGTPEFDAMELVLKGPEVKLPDGVVLADTEGHPRRRIRARWFAPPREWSYSSLVFPPSPLVPAIEIPAPQRPRLPYYAESAPPLFFGHYWMPAESTPSLLAPNLACLDWSIARGGKLVAYAWNGERVLDPAKLIWVRHASADPTRPRPARTMPA